jgi:hypothetical protein
MHKLAEMDPKPVVVLQIRQNPIYCFINDVVLKGTSIFCFDEHLVNPKTWYLVGDATDAKSYHPSITLGAAKQKSIHKRRLTAPSP